MRAHEQNKRKPTDLAMGASPQTPEVLRIKGSG